MARWSPSRRNKSGPKEIPTARSTACRFCMMPMFTFKQFSIDDSRCAMKVGTDSVLLGAWADVAHVHSVIDVGAGSGILALMIAQRAPEARVTAVEIDAEAAAGAAANIAASPWACRCRAVRGDVASYSPEAPADMMICNPPYFTGALRAPDRQRATARHAEGTLSPLSAIALAERWLAPEGSLAMVTPADIADDVVFEAEMRRMDVWRMCMVSTATGKAPSRILWQLSRKGCHPTESRTRLYIRSEGKLTDEYRSLTSDFYLH